MNKFAVPIILFAFGLDGCDSDCNRASFAYNETTGKCENCKGEVGFNDFDIEEIRKSKNAECLDLNRQNLVYLLDASKIENFNDLGYNILDGYNFRGSKFDSASLFFNFIYHADFSGADLRTLDYGYAAIRGKIDQYTLLPVEGQCETRNDSLNCAR